ncbi:hypothetical protein TI03_06530, partial [Achromatium sp. WMS1]
FLVLSLVSFLFVWVRAVLFFSPTLFSSNNPSSPTGGSPRRAGGGGGGGGPRLASINAIGDLSHTLETLLDGLTPELRAKHPNTLNLAQRCAERLSEQVDQVSRGSPVTRAQNLINELEYTHALITGNNPPPPVDIKPEPVPTPSPDTNEKSVAPPKEQVRVRADLLNRMISNAGEIGIYRARLEQHNNNLKFNLDELTQTVIRLNEQLRKMNVETEAQMRHRRGEDTPDERMSQDDEIDKQKRELDPLELDRFSTIQLLSRTLSETANDLLNIKSLLGEQYKEMETLLI